MQRPSTARVSQRLVASATSRAAIVQQSLPLPTLPRHVQHSSIAALSSMATLSPAVRLARTPLPLASTSTVFRSPDAVRNGQQAALAFDVIALMDALKIRRAILGGFDWGARTADIVAALWPDRCLGLIAVSGYLIGSQQANATPLPPKAELAWWYQFYFATERGRVGYETNRHAFNKLIWQMASPQWHFDDRIYERSAKSFDNPDHVAIVIHNYRWRLGLVEGEAHYEAAEAALAATPPIAVPTITMEGDANGAAHPEPRGYRARFTGPYEHRLIGGGVGHNLPQEAPAAFADAVLSIAHMD